MFAALINRKFAAGKENHFRVFFGGENPEKSARDENAMRTADKGVRGAAIKER